MSLSIYNTMNGRKESFVPLEDGKAKLYVCGPTVYDDSHIGHARAVVVFDVLVRHLKAIGYDVTYVRNFTDLDDKIINRANERGVEFLELAEGYIKSFHDDMDALGTLRPDKEPRATHYVELMIKDVQALMDKGHAYRIEGDVYFDVTTWPAYGKLSGRKLEDMQAGARVGVDERKRNPWDFALWKESKPGEPSWPTPWGKPGRPGWHIECSVMSNEILGAEFDIHGGGHDLIFPHHENEIAQAEPLGRKFAKYWMHNGFVRVNEEKMSKSLGNFFTVKDLLAKFDPEVIRLFLLSIHYRSPIEFSDEGLVETGRSLDRAYRALQEAIKLGVDPANKASIPESEKAVGLFREAMDDDLNTSRALGHLFDSVRELNKAIDAARSDGVDMEKAGAWAAAIVNMSEVIGILQRDPEEYFEARSAGRLDESGLSPEKIEEMIQLRADARKNKNWAEADRIRDELKDAGVILEDAGGQTTWRLAT